MNELEKQMYREQAKNGKRWCFDCDRFYKETTCGYNSCQCFIVGSLDCDQNKYHPCTTADTCKHYNPNGKLPWYER